MSETVATSTLTGVELIELISMKNEYPREAELAFAEFRYRYESDILKKAEIYCAKWGYSEVEALQIAHCTFDRVWKYPTFKVQEGSKNIDKSVILWMSRIVYTQLILTIKKNTCIEPTEEEDISTINIDSIAETISELEDNERQDLLVHELIILQQAMEGLSEKHKIVYLTYKAYRPTGKKIPRSVSKKLREQLELTQSSIGVYRMEAEKHINDFISKHHG